MRIVFIGTKYFLEMTKHINNMLKRLAREKHIIRFLCSRLLRRTTLSRLFIIDKGLYKMRFYPTSVLTSYWYDKDLQKEDEDLIKSLLEKGDTFVDVGANVGNLSFTASVAVGEEGRVFAFEPHPQIYKYLCKNTKLNNFKNIRSTNLAIGSREGDVYISDFYADDYNKIVSKSNIEAHMSTLDSTINTDIKLLKVDAEGMESDIFMGAKETLKRTKHVYYEVNKGSQATEVLKSLGFSVKDTGISSSPETKNMLASNKGVSLRI